MEHPPRFRYALSTDGVYRKPALRQDKALISCVGDMLAEEKLYKSHLIGGRTDFHDVFTFVRPYFAASDLTVGNLETMLCAAAPYTGEQYKVDGKYHCNAPQSFLDAVRQAGFDFLMLANNHNLDCGAAGIRETLNRIDDAGLMRTGLFAGPAERRCARVEVNGIRLALLSWSTWYNRNETRLTDEGRRALLNEYAPDRAASDIAAARAAGAEFVLTYIHWGVDAEYKTEPSASMRRMAQELADAGADYIVRPAPRPHHRPRWAHRACGVVHGQLCHQRADVRQPVHRHPANRADAAERQGPRDGGDVHPLLYS